MYDIVTKKAIEVTSDTSNTLSGSVMLAVTPGLF